MSVKASEIVEAARQLEGAYYRWWYVGASLPMWLDDGYQHPPASHILPPGVGVMCSDLLNFARQECGLPSIGGTTDYSNAIVNFSRFDPNTPGIAGAVCVNPYYSPYHQGHVALYTGEHQIIQALVNPGVTEAYTDTETSTWEGCEFEWYGFMADVDYSDEGEDPTEASAAWVRNGWYQVEDDWNLTYFPASA